MPQFKPSRVPNCWPSTLSLFRCLKLQRNRELRKTLLLPCLVTSLALGLLGPTWTQAQTENLNRTIALEEESPLALSRPVCPTPGAFEEPSQRLLRQLIKAFLDPDTPYPQPQFAHQYLLNLRAIETRKDPMGVGELAAVSQCLESNFSLTEDQPQQKLFLTELQEIHKLNQKLLRTLRFRIPQSSVEKAVAQSALNLKLWIESQMEALDPEPASGKTRR